MKKGATQAAPRLRDAARGLGQVVFGLVLTVLALALHDRLRGHAPALARVIAGWGMIWSCLLIASGAVANMGIGGHYPF